MQDKTIGNAQNKTKGNRIYNIMTRTFIDIAEFQLLRCITYQSCNMNESESWV